MSHPRIRCETLPNGLTVLLREAHLAPVAEIQIWARVGSADEGDHERGLAHFHEHMLFKGTERRGVGEVAGEIEGAGGRINAYTTFDATVYHATLPSDRLAIGIDVLSDAVLHSTFDPDEISREIEVVLEEIRRGEDSPSSVLGNAIFDEHFRVHPYRAPILGSLESVAAIDRERVRAFYEHWYTPDNLCVVATGDFESDQVLEAVRTAFGDIPRGTPERVRPTEPEPTELHTRVLTRPFERTNISLVHSSTGLGDPDTPYLDLVAYVLGGCDSSRLVRRVKERDGLVDQIDAYSYTPLNPGVSAIDIETDAVRAPAAIEAVVYEIERLRAEPVSEEEMDRARVNFLASEQFERESVSGLASKLGNFHVIGGGWQTERDYIQTIRNSTPRDLQRVAQKYLNAKRLTVAALLPDSDSGGVDDARVSASVTRGVERAKRAFAAPRPGRAKNAELVSYELDGGVQLHVLPRREIPIVAARAAFLGGLLCEDASTSGLTAFTTSMWLRGTRTHSAAGFAAATEGRAVEIDSFSGRSSFGLTLESPSDQLDPALELFSEVLLAPAFDRDEIERERAETLAAIERREDRLAQRTFLLFMGNHFRKHPYRMPTLGSKEVIEALDRDAIQTHHQRLVKAKNLVLAVAGDVDPDAVAAQISARLSELDASPFEQVAPPDEEMPHEIRRASVHKDRAQAHLVIGFRGVTVSDGDRFALEVIAQLLTGQGGRLFLELRDRRGLAYTVDAVNIEGMAPGYFAVYIATAPEKLEEARSGLLRELENLIAAVPSESELERARRHLIGNFAIDQQRNAVHAAQISLSARYGLGPDAASHYPDQIATVDAETLLRVARRIFDMNTYTEAIVRP